jgi:TatD DNase family protein
MLIDTHAHLDLEDFDNDRDEVIRRAQTAGIEYIINPGIHLESSRRCVELAEKYDCIYAAVGVHPHDSQTFDENTIDELRELAAHPKVVAIGEIGLDHHYDLAPHDVQERVFREQIRLANELHKPLIIHSRDAERKVLDILREERAHMVRGILHCWGGTLEEAREGRKLGFLVGFGGAVTFKNSDRLDVARKMVIDSIVVETDAPYMAPVPMRGKRNEPAFMAHTAKKLISAGPFTLDDVERITSHNAKKLFGIGDSEPSRIAYPIRESLYLNITNRCTLACTFCPKFRDYNVKGHNLELQVEPTPDEVMDAIGDPLAWDEIVFCGYGEPTLRLDLIKDVASRLKKAGVKHIRINTDGLANFVYERDVTPELDGLIDSLSVSLNAPDEVTYNKLCRPGKPGNAYQGMKDFITKAKAHIPQITATVVGMPKIDVEECRRIVEDELGVTFKAREYTVMG